MWTREIESHQDGWERKGVDLSQESQKCQFFLNVEKEQNKFKAF